MQDVSYNIAYSPFRGDDSELALRFQQRRVYEYAVSKNWQEAVVRNQQKPWKVLSSVHIYT